MRIARLIAAAIAWWRRRHDEKVRAREAAAADEWTATHSIQPSFTHRREHGSPPELD